MSDSFATPWTVAHQAPVSMGFPRQEYWSGLPFPFLVNYTSKKKKTEEKIKLCVWNFVFWPYVNGHSDIEKRFLGVIWWPKICAKTLKTTETHFMDTSSYRKGCFAILVMNLGTGNSWEFWENLCLEINQVQDSKIPIVKHTFTASLLYTQQPLASLWKILSLWNWSLALYVYSHHTNTEFL